MYTLILGLSFANGILVEIVFFVSEDNLIVIAYLFLRSLLVNFSELKSSLCCFLKSLTVGGMLTAFYTKRMGSCNAV